MIFEMEYLGMMPGIKDNVGVGIVVFRAENGTLRTFEVSLQRAALERMQEDIETLLASSPALNTDETVDQAADRTIIPESVLTELGFNELEYLGSSE